MYANLFYQMTVLAFLLFWIFLKIGTVKKLGGSFKIVHDKFRSKATEESTSLYLRQLNDILAMHPELKPQVQKPVVLSKFSN